MSPRCAVSRKATERIDHPSRAIRVGPHKIALHSASPGNAMTSISRIATKSMPAQTALFLAIMANSAGQVFLLAMLPPLGRRLGFSDIETGAILSVSALILIVAAPLWGSLSERRGRRPVLLVALAAAAAAPLAFALIIAERMAGAIGSGFAFTLIFAARITQTLLSAGLLPATQAYVADVTDADRRAGGMGIIGAAYGFGAITGAALAWRFGGDLVAVALAGLAAAAAVALASVFFLAGEPARRCASGFSSVSHLSLGRIWPFLAITFVAIIGYSIVQQVVALRLQDAMRFSSEESITNAGLALMATALAMIVVQGGVLPLVRFRPETLLVIGAPLATLALLLAAFAKGYAELFGALVVLGTALGLMLPGNLASLSLRTGADAQGKAAGLNVVGQGMGLALGPIAGATLHQLSPQAPFLVAAALLAAASILALHARRRPSKIA